MIYYMKNFSGDLDMKRIANIGNHTAIILFSITAFIALTLTGCAKTGGSSPLVSGSDKSGKALVSAAAGGTVQLNDEVTLTVPAGALLEDTRISIQRVKDAPAGDADGLFAFGQAYRFLPKGTEFTMAEPALLEMSYDNIALGAKGYNPETMQLCYFDEELACYVPVDCRIDTIRKKIIARIEHFTVYLPMAKALQATNNAPYVALQSPWPTAIRAGAPIYIRATATDNDGAIAGVTVRYRKLQPSVGAWQTARMLKENNPQAALNTYGYVIPSSFLSGADLGKGSDIEVQAIATDNLGAVTNSNSRAYNVNSSYQAGSLFINPAVLDISAGSQSYMLCRGIDSNGNTFSLVPETFSMRDGSSTLENRFAQGILLSAVSVTPSGSPDQMEVGFGSESAVSTVTVHAGGVESLEILDTNGLPISGDLGIPEGTLYEFDVVGHDGYGNNIPVITSWSADAGIGTIGTDGILDTTWMNGPGVVSASLVYLTDDQNVVVQSRNKEITAFSINGVNGEIAHPFITVTLPWGTDVTGLVADFTTTGATVTANSAVQQSGVSDNDFTDPVVYTVTAEDGTSQDYTVQVKMLSPYKDFTSFTVSGANVLIGTSEITINFPAGTSVTSLIPEYEISGKLLKVDDLEQQSGVSIHDFTNPVYYTVYAEDGSAKLWKVSVAYGRNITGTVTHYAGTTGGIGTRDGIGSAARFNQPYGIATDGSNLYITDENNNLIKKMVLATGEISTIAGVACHIGSSDGIGTEAYFSQPYGISLVGSNLYIVDSQNHTIRRVVIATGEVTTIAGLAESSGWSDGIGDTARFNYPKGITSDGTYLYVVDSSSHTIRKIDLATSQVTTIAGLANNYGSTDATGTAARFKVPSGITNDGVNLYVTDTANYTIRKIVIATGAVSTFAGTAGSSGSSNGVGTAARFYYPREINCDGTYLYVSDAANNTIRKITLATKDVTTLAGTAGNSGAVDGTGSAARFNTPSGITNDGTNLFIADFSNNTIRKVVLSTTEVSTLAGLAGLSGSANGIGSAATFYIPNDITNDGTNLYVADTGNSIIRKIDVATGEVTTIAGLARSKGSTDGYGSVARFNNPYGITSDGTNLYVSDTINDTIRKIVIATGEVTTIAGQPGYDGYQDGVGTETYFWNPVGLSTDGINLYIVDRTNFVIRKMLLATGEVTTIAGLANSLGTGDGIGSAARFYYPLYITSDGASLYVTDSSSNTIRKIVIDTNEVTTIAGQPGVFGSDDGTGTAALFGETGGITNDGTYLYISDVTNQTIRRLKIATDEVTTIAGLAGMYGSEDGSGSEARFCLQEGLTMLGAYLYVADSYNHCIKRIE
jgi:hypothetical protein